MLYLAVILTFFAAAPGAHCQEHSADQSNILDADESNLLRWLPEPYRNWLIRDVGYIISKQERRNFLQLTTDNDREDFIKYFWQRRNPDPDSSEMNIRLKSTAASPTQTTIFLLGMSPDG